MAIERLDHYSIRTTDVESTRKFYTDVLGLEAGPRPDFPFPGVWLYQGNAAMVHVIGTDLHDTAGPQDDTGAIDHVAFLGRDIEGMRAHFKSTQVSFQERIAPTLNLQQIFLHDPNGITIELNFPQ